MMPSSYFCLCDLNLKFSLLAYKDREHLNEASGPLEEKKEYRSLPVTEEWKS